MDKNNANSGDNSQNQEESPQGENDSLESARKQAEEYLDGWKRAKAELINYKKDEVKRFEQLAKFANETLIREMINVLDSFDLAVVALERGGQSVEKGVYLIRAQMEDVLKNHGLERVVVSVGAPFDPALQEAVAVVESDKPSGTVVEEIERGYMMRGKLIRPARVKVAR